MEVPQPFPGTARRCWGGVWGPASRVVCVYRSFTTVSRKIMTRILSSARRAVSRTKPDLFLFLGGGGMIKIRRMQRHQIPPRVLQRPQSSSWQGSGASSPAEKSPGTNPGINPGTNPTVSCPNPWMRVWVVHEDAHGPRGSTEGKTRQGRHLNRKNTTWVYLIGKHQLP